MMRYKQEVIMSFWTFIIIWLILGAIGKIGKED